MKLSDFSFDLPEARIAKFPAGKRSESKLMVVNRETGDVTHHIFSELPDLLEKNDFLIMNNTKVDPVRIFALADQKRVEILVIKKISENIFEGFALPAKRLKIGTKLDFGNGRLGVVESSGYRGKRTISCNCSSDKVIKDGFAPLPPYLKRKFKEASEYKSFDLERYQTVYSKNPGSIAAPTAGLHFDKAIIDIIKLKNKIFEITLSVGHATFQKIEVENINDHKMGREFIHIEKKVADEIKKMKSTGGNLVAVGTTSVRSLETFALLDVPLESFASELFIRPGFKFKMVDKLITNFHLPESSLFILVSAFAGLELMIRAYQIAIKNGYNFFSYGDAMLII